MTTEGNSSSIASYQKKKKKKEKKEESLYLFFWHSDHQREELLQVCGWKGHLLGQLDEVSAVSLQCVDIETPSIPHPFPSQPWSLNSFHILFPLCPPYHALSFQKTLERRKWKYGMCRQDTSLYAEQNWWTWKQLEESRFTRDTLTHLLDTYHALYVSV